ncbi:MAG TPA: hypothetical protein VMW72_20835 [Sedimentisphaerales bacterium]|nr:hypothetical protein [Sedimentisphaerales bacterium]
MNVSIYIEMAYENKRNWTLGENKPNFVKGPKLAQTSLLQRIMKMKPPSGPKKQTQNKPNLVRRRRIAKGQNRLPKNLPISYFNKPKKILDNPG